MILRSYLTTFLIKVEKSDIKEGRLRVPDGVKTISIGAAYRFSEITSLKLPASLKKIDSNAFSFCTRLTTLTLPDSLKEIGWDAFSCCTRLTTLTLPDSLETIKRSAFNYCPNITDILVGTDNKASWARIVLLLPDNLRNKVLPLERGKAILDKKQNIKKAALLKFLSTPSIAAILCGLNLAKPLYDYPLEMISNIQSFQWDANPKGQALLKKIEAIQLSGVDSLAFKAYETSVNTCRKVFAEALLRDASQHPEKRINVYPSSYQGRLNRHINLLHTVREDVTNSDDYNEDQKNKTKEKMGFDIALSQKLIEIDKGKRPSNFSQKEQQALSQTSFQAILKNSPNQNTFFKSNVECNPDTRSAKRLRMTAS